MKILKSKISYKPNSRLSLTGLFNNELEIDILSEMIGDKVMKYLDIEDMSLYDWQKLSSLRNANIDPDDLKNVEDEFDNLDSDIKRKHSLELINDMIYYSFHSVPDISKNREYGTIHKRYGQPIEVYHESKSNNNNQSNYLYLLSNGNYAIDDGKKTRFFKGQGNSENLNKIIEKEYNKANEEIKIG